MPSIMFRILRLKKYHQMTKEAHFFFITVKTDETNNLPERFLLALCHHVGTYSITRVMKNVPQ